MEWQEIQDAAFTLHSSWQRTKALPNRPLAPTAAVKSVLTLFSTIVPSPTSALPSLPLNAMTTASFYNANIPALRTCVATI